MRRHAHYGLKASPGSFNRFLGFGAPSHDLIKVEDCAECADFAAEHGVLLACDGTEHHDSGWYSDEQGYQVLLIANHRTGTWRVAEEWHCESPNAVVSPTPDDVWYRMEPRTDKYIARIVKYSPRVVKTLHDAAEAGLLPEEGQTGGMGVAGVPWSSARTRVIACSKLEVLESHLTCLSESSGFERETKAARFLQENRQLGPEEAAATVWALLGGVDESAQVLQRAMSTAKAQAMRKAAIQFKLDAQTQASYPKEWPQTFEKLFVQRDFHMSKCVFTSKDKERLLAREGKLETEIEHKIDRVMEKLRPANVAMPIYGMSLPQLPHDLETHSEPRQIEILCSPPTKAPAKLNNN
eukprot:TRINITY_DN8051_c0_g1_i2.p1 TRINITY_DN8051_c0_g1~~TRINITY_DN8051_c0_g1_i2.p1  ORF type:complete len:353 (-),score=60.57 TRINITY_DN8051_c0_g1_i2:2-1060(-)